MISGKLRLSRLFVVIVLLILGVTLFLYKDLAKNAARSVLESNWPTVVIWLLAAIGVVAGRFFSEEPKNQSGTFILDSFGNYADAVFTVATYGFAGSTSLALLKGLCLQLLFDKIYFSGFGGFDLASIVVVSSFLLYYAVIGTAKQIIEVVFQVEAAAVTKV